MTAIGDGPTELWTAELRRTGRVAFPLGRQPLLRQTWSTFGLLGLLAVAGLPHALKISGVQLIVVIVVTTAVVIGLCFSIWQLLTRGPVLTIDTGGVRLGRRRFMAWSEIDAITELEGPPGDRRFAVVSKVHRRKLWIGPEYVRNVVAFRYWLLDLLEDRRTVASPG